VTVSVEGVKAMFLMETLVPVVVVVLFPEGVPVESFLQEDIANEKISANAMMPFPNIIVFITVNFMQSYDTGTPVVNQQSLAAGI